MGRNIYLSLSSLPVSLPLRPTCLYSTQLNRGLSYSAYSLAPQSHFPAESPDLRQREKKDEKCALFDVCSSHSRRWLVFERYIIRLWSAQWSVEYPCTHAVTHKPTHLRPIKNLISWFSHTAELKIFVSFLDDKYSHRSLSFSKNHLAAIVNCSADNERIEDNSRCFSRKEK